MPLQGLKVLFAQPVECLIPRMNFRVADVHTCSDIPYFEQGLTVFQLSNPAVTCLQLPQEPRFNFICHLGVRRPYNAASTFIFQASKERPAAAPVGFIEEKGQFLVSMRPV